MPVEPLPAPGLGTSSLKANECAETVEDALEAGYRHVDTAQMYDNERAVGAAIEASSVDREDVFLATKVHPDSLSPGDVAQSTRKSLGRLDVERVDLLYVHWPTRAYDAEATLSVFDALREAGLTRHVGVSNFTPGLLAEAIDILESPLFAHQVECHPLLPQTRLLEMAREFDHYVVAYSPLGRGEVLDHPVVAAVAVDQGATPAQVALAWQLDRGVVPIPQGRGDHVRENLAAREVHLSEDALRRLDAIADENRVVDLGEAPWN